MSLSVFSSAPRFGSAAAPALVVQKEGSAPASKPVNYMIHVHKLLKNQDALAHMSPHLILGVVVHASQNDIQTAYDRMTEILNSAIQQDPFENTKQSKKALLQTVDRAYQDLNPSYSDVESSPVMLDAKKTLGLSPETKITLSVLQNAYNAATQEGKVKSIDLTEAYTKLYPASQVAGLIQREISAPSKAQTLSSLLRLPADAPKRLAHSSYDAVQSYYQSSIQALQERIQKLEKSSDALKEAYEAKFMPWITILNNH